MEIEAISQIMLIFVLSFIIGFAVCSIIRTYKVGIEASKIGKELLHLVINETMKIKMKKDKNGKLVPDYFIVNPLSKIDRKKIKAAPFGIIESSDIKNINLTKP